ncbi:MAG: TIGR04282 family arsenosugar biosynthesis glycosyltransferase [Rhodanobacter sp.]
MTPALALFVKTPGLSPVKTRLAATLGVPQATQFYRLSAAATMAVARRCQKALIPYWAVAEADADASLAWSGAAHVWQGEGALGARLHKVYAELRARHGRVLLIGADAPQLTPALLIDALTALDAAPFVCGDAADGGFWLFGGREPIVSSAWLGVRYSQADTAAQLRHALASHGHVAGAPTLADVDTAKVLPELVRTLAALSEPLAEQRALLRWLQATLQPVRSQSAPHLPMRQ